MRWRKKIEPVVEKCWTCSKPAVERCIVIANDGFECVRLGCADHRCHCSEGLVVEI